MGAHKQPINLFDSYIAENIHYQTFEPIQSTTNKKNCRNCRHCRRSCTLDWSKTLYKHQTKDENGICYEWRPKPLDSLHDPLEIIEWLSCCKGRPPKFPEYCSQCFQYRLGKQVRQIRPSLEDESSGRLASVENSEGISREIFDKIIECFDSAGVLSEILPASENPLLDDGTQPLHDWLIVAGNRVGIVVDFCVSTVFATPPSLLSACRAVYLNYIGIPTRYVRAWKPSLESIDSRQVQTFNNLESLLGDAFPGFVEAITGG